MKPITYYSTNDPTENASFETALLNGMASHGGLYMVSRKEVPKLSPDQIRGMKSKPYADIAFEVLHPYLGAEIKTEELEALLHDAYDEQKIPTHIQHVTGKSYIMWLTQGPTYSFKDYAARFFGRALNHFLGNKELKRTVVVATSGDTGGAVADALHGLDNIDNVVLFPKGSISEGQRRQMTTLGGNIYAIEVNGDFDVCQELAKYILSQKEFAAELFGDGNRFTSANSISVGRLLPQAVYPFFAYSRIAENGEPMIASIPSGNFGDMMGTVIAKEMGLPVSKILVGLNENTEFLDFMRSGEYTVRPSIKSPSSAMVVSHPSNLARLIDFYGGHMVDQKDATGKVIQPGVIDRMPDLASLRNDLFVHSCSNQMHYATMKQVFDQHKIILDPHGAVGWYVLELFFNGLHDRLAVVYETADPGKFPEDVKKAIGVIPELPPGMKRQANIEQEQIFPLLCEPDHTEQGLRMSKNQMEEIKLLIACLFL